MRKFAIAGVILLILSVLIAFAVYNLGRLVNRNKDYILAQAEQALGRTVTVEDIGVTVWGGIGVRLKNIALADDRTFSSQHFLRAADLQVNVEFLPLLQKELRVKRLILHQPVITVIRNDKGTFNFASLGRPRRPEGPTTSQPATSGKPTGFPLLVSLVDVADGQVRYLDRKDGIDLRISQLDLTVEKHGSDRPVSIDVAAALNADRQNLKIQGNIGPLPPTGALSDITGLPLSGTIILGPVALADLKHLVQLDGTLPKGLSVDGPLSLNTHVDGKLTDLSLKGKVEATEAAVRLGDRLRKPKGVPLHLSTNARVTTHKITLEKVTLKLHTLDLSGTGSMTRGKRPVVQLTMDSGRTDLAGWERILPLLQGYTFSGDMEVHGRIQGRMTKDDTPDINGSATFTGLRAALPQVPGLLTTQKATVTFTGQQAALKETPFQLGKSQFRLAADVSKLSPLALTYHFSATEIRMADLREVTRTTKNPEVVGDAKSNGRVWTEKGSLAFRGRFTSARGTIADVDYTNLHANIAMANRVATIEDLRLQAYNGSVKGRGRYDMRKTPPLFTLTSVGRGMDISAFFRSASAAKHIRGKANLDLTLAGSGDQWEEIRRGLSGQGQATVFDGALLDVNIAEGALTGLTGLPGISLFFSPRVRGKYPAIFGTKNTEFGQLKGSLNLKNGKVHLENLLMAAADWTVRGKGWVTPLP
jgi:uncharacterized protein involved in outer membrane biogenesis